jgi:hypothetical protein
MNAPLLAIGRIDISCQNGDFSLVNAVRFETKSDDLKSMIS